jgi:3-oxoacyl-[acyl-carrier protein] reductase
MTNAYQSLISRGPARAIASKLGLPRPAELRRYNEGDPLVPGPVLVIGSSSGTEEISGQLLSWGLDVRTHDAGAARLGGIVAVLDDVDSPSVRG